MSLGYMAVFTLYIDQICIHFSHTLSATYHESYTELLSMYRECVCFPKHCLWEKVTELELHFRPRTSYNTLESNERTLTPPTGNLY